MKLFVEAFAKFMVGVISIGLLLFIIAGTFDYLNGWLFIIVLFVPMSICGIILLFKNPDLLKKRLNTREQKILQKLVSIVSGFQFVIGLAVAGLDYRFGWSYVPICMVIVASFVLFVSYILYVEIMRENIYLSRTVEIQEEQIVVDKGLYSIVRHPMYGTTLLIFYSIPIVLGSWWSTLCFLPYVLLISVRIWNEEKILEEGLDGYAEYKSRVKYKLIPFVW